MTTPMTVAEVKAGSSRHDYDRPSRPDERENAIDAINCALENEVNDHEGFAFGWADPDSYDDEDAKPGEGIKLAFTVRHAREKGFEGCLPEELRDLVDNDNYDGQPTLYHLDVEEVATQFRNAGWDVTVELLPLLRPTPELIERKKRAEAKKKKPVRKAARPYHPYGYRGDSEDEDTDSSGIKHPKGAAVWDEDRDGALSLSRPAAVPSVIHKGYEQVGNAFALFTIKPSAHMSFSTTGASTDEEPYDGYPED